MFWSACALLRAEGFSCSLGVLYGGLGISKLQFLIKKIKIKISSCEFFSILGHQTLDPDPESGSAIRKNAGSGSALNQCGSATLAKNNPIYPTLSCEKNPYASPMVLENLGSDKNSPLWQCCGSMTFWCKSGSMPLTNGSGSGFCYFLVIDLQDANKKLI
jgi:hypothetical protein